MGPDGFSHMAQVTQVEEVEIGKFSPDLIHIVSLDLWFKRSSMSQWMRMDWASLGLGHDILLSHCQVGTCETDLVRVS